MRDAEHSVNNFTCRQFRS